MIGILTFQKTTNFGAALQIYALTTTINKLGGSCEVIQYYNSTIEQTENYFYFKEKNIKNFIRIILLGLPNYILQKKFEKFSKDFLKLSVGKYNSNDIIDTNNIYSSFIVGSDQVWNHKLTGNDTTYYLDFVNDKKKKNSYAASFGINDAFRQDNNQKICQYLKEFNVLSVREKQAASEIQHYTDLNANVSLDPTFLLTTDDWECLAQKSKYNETKDSYILVYMPKDRKKVFPKIVKFAKENGLKIKYVTDNYFKYTETERLTTPTPMDFIALIKNAKFIFSGSYHGFILGLNFNKPVLIEYEKKKNNFNSRLESVISEFELESTIYNGGDLAYLGIEYKEFNTKLDKKREESLHLIRGIING